MRDKGRKREKEEIWKEGREEVKGKKEGKERVRKEEREEGRKKGRR